MKVLVTGGAGFIGSHTVELLQKAGHQVVVVDDLSNGDRCQVPEQATFYQVKVESPQLRQVFEEERPEVVIHLAAQMMVARSILEPLFDAQINIMGTLNVLENCRKYGVRKIVYSSSAAVYGNPQYLGIDEMHPVNPLSFYGITKYTPEAYIQRYAEMYNLSYTILRYANVYGIRQGKSGEGGVIYAFANQILRGKNPVIYGDGRQTRDFVYVEDVAYANLCAIASGDGEILNIGTNQPCSLHDLLALFREIFGGQIKPQYTDERPGDIRHSYLNNEKARLLLGWKPKTSLEQGLRITLHYYQERLQKGKETA